MKKINVIDVIIFVAITAALIVGYFTYKHYRETAGDRVESNAKIGFQVFLRGVTLTSNENPIIKGDKTFITIRNVPYTELEILDSKIETKKTVLPNVANPKEPLITNDYSQLFMYDIIVTIADNGKVTKDGAVIGGNKIKIGLPITLEGPSYKLNGTVSDVRILLDKPQAPPAQAGPVEVSPQGSAQAPQAGQPQAGQPQPAPQARPNQPAPPQRPAK